MFTSSQASAAISSIKYRTNHKNTAPVGLKAQGVFPNAPRIRCKHNPHFPPNLGPTAGATEVDSLARLLSMARQRPRGATKRAAVKVMNPAIGTRGCVS